MLRRLVLALGVVIALSGIAEAKDFCIAWNGSIIAVGKGFTNLPAKGRCKPFSGFIQSTAVLLSGNACVSSDGLTARFNLSSANSSGLETFTTTLNLPARTGTGRDCSNPSVGDGSCTTFSAAVVTCSPSNVPVP